MAQNKSKRGNFFEDFRLGQTIEHATPRTVNSGDVAFYTALYGGRFAVQSSDAFARALGYPQSPIDDLLAFHIVFGKTVPDISLNAVANLGYAECRFLRPVYPGDTITATSQVVGLRENSNRQSGVVYVRTTGRDAEGRTVVDYVRWVMVRKRDPSSPAPAAHIPSLAEAVRPELLGVDMGDLKLKNYDFKLSGSALKFDDYEIGEKIDHVDGTTLEEAEHQLATRLYQNTAKVHFNRLEQERSQFGRRLVYGGHIISIARALSFNGIENAFHVAAINGGRHVAPAAAGDTIYAWSEVLDKAPSAHPELGALRLRLVALKDKPADGFPYKSNGAYDPAVLLDLDYWVLLPR